MTTAAALAADLGVDEGDVDVLLVALEEPALVLPDELAGFLRRMLDPHREQTAPPGMYWPGSGEGPRRLFGLSGPDSTAL